MAAIQTPDDKLAAKYEARFQAAQQARVEFEKQWYLNMAFYFGRQWAAWAPTVSGNNTALKLQEPPAPRWRVRSTTNKIRPIIRKEITKLTKEEPQFFVIPATTEESDVAAARAAEHISEYLLTSKNYNAVRALATFWTAICGTGFIKTWYDPDKPDEDDVPGKILYEAIAPFHIYVPNLQIVEIEDQPEIYHARAIEPDTVKALYGEDVLADVEVSGTHLDQRFQTALGIKKSKNKSSEQVFLKEVWVKPCANFPEGAMFVIGNNKLLYIYEGIQEAPDHDPSQHGPQVEQPGPDGSMPVVGKVTSDYPYDHKMYPFAKIDHIPTGRFYAESTIYDLIPLQKEYNRTRSQIIEAKNKTSKPQWSVTKGAINPNKMTSEPGLIVEVNPGYDAPKPLDNPEPSQFVHREIEIISRDIDESSNQYEVTKGRTPPGVEAASAIAYLQEENDSILHHTVASIEAAVQKTGIQSLALVHQFWDEPRIVRVVSMNNLYETKKFKGSDLKGYMDFRVETDSMAPRSRAAKQAFITELMSMGAIPPEQALKYLHMNETNRLYQDMQLDARHAQRENFRIASGVAIHMNQFDNNAVHKMEHESYMKTQEYELLPEEIQAAFIMHLNEHNQAIAEEMQMAQERGMEGVE